MRDDVPSRLPTHLLQAEEEIALARAIEAGVLAGALLEGGLTIAIDEVTEPSVAELDQLVSEGRRAQRQLVEANLRLVVMVARQAAVRSRVPVADLFQEGCLGLLVGVQRFDHRRGNRFATYALHWIRAYVGAASASRLGEMNLPSGRAALLRSARGLAEVVSQQLGRSAAIEELAAQLGRSTRWTEELLSTRSPVSLDGQDGAGLLGLLTASEPDRADPAAAERLVRRLVRGLPPQQRQVLVLRMGLGGEAPVSYAQLSLRLDITVGRIKRIEAAALERLRSRCPYSAREHLSA